MVEGGSVAGFGFGLEYMSTSLKRGNLVKSGEGTEGDSLLSKGQ